MSAPEVNVIEIRDDDYSFAIVVADENGNIQSRIAKGEIPVDLSSNLRRIFGLLDRDYAVYTMRVLEIGEFIFWRVFKHPSILASDYPSTILPAVELVYEHSAVKATLGYGYGYGYLFDYGAAYAEVYKDDVYIFIQYPMQDSSGKTVIACPAGVFVMATTSDESGIIGDGVSVATARMQDGGFIRAYTRDTAGYGG